VRTIFTAVFLFALWLLMSGIYKPMIVGFGAVSVVLIMVVTRRMDAADGDRVQLDLKPLALIGYLAWLLVEIAKANWAVTRIVLSPKMPIRQHLFKVPFSQKTDLAQVLFANSITLTPGTISVESGPNDFLVHALAYCAEDNLALAEMDRHVSLTERRVTT